MHVNITKTGDNNIIFNSGQKTSVGKKFFRKGLYFFVSVSVVVGHFCVSLIKEKVLLSRKTVYAKNAGTDRLSVFITNLAGISVPLKN